MEKTLRGYWLKVWGHFSIVSLSAKMEKTLRGYWLKVWGHFSVVSLSAKVEKTLRGCWLKVWGHFSIVSLSAKVGKNTEGLLAESMESFFYCVTFSQGGQCMHDYSGPGNIKVNVSGVIPFETPTLNRTPNYQGNLRFQQRLKLCSCRYFFRI